MTCTFSLTRPDSSLTGLNFSLVGPDSSQVGPVLSLVRLLLSLVSLVPRPFPPPVFDRFQYENGGGRPGRKSHVRDVR